MEREKKKSKIVATRGFGGGGLETQTIMSVNLIRGLSKVNLKVRFEVETLLSLYNFVFSFRLFFNA